VCPSQVAVAAEALGVFTMRPTAEKSDGVGAAYSLAAAPANAK
jgi:hypothetical protein